jgi:hypothetical protein
MTRMAKPYRFWSKSLKEGEYLGNLWMNARIILKWMLSKQKACMKVEARDDANRKVAADIPHEFTAFFKEHNPSIRNMVLEILSF